MEKIDQEALKSNNKSEKELKNKIARGLVAFEHYWKYNKRATDGIIETVYKNIIK